MYPSQQNFAPGRFDAPLNWDYGNAMRPSTNLDANPTPQLYYQSGGSGGAARPGFLDWTRQATGTNTVLTSAGVPFAGPEPTRLFTTYGGQSSPGQAAFTQQMSPYRESLDAGSMDSQIGSMGGGVSPQSFLNDRLRSGEPLLSQRNILVDSRDREAARAFLQTPLPSLQPQFMPSNAYRSNPNYASGDIRQESFLQTQSVPSDGRVAVSAPMSYKSDNVGQFVYSRRPSDFLDARSLEGGLGTAQSANSFAGYDRTAEAAFRQPASFVDSVASQRPSSPTDTFAQVPERGGSGSEIEALAVQAQSFPTSAEDAQKAEAWRAQPLYSKVLNAGPSLHEQGQLLADPRTSQFESTANKNLRQLIRESFLQTQDTPANLKAPSVDLGAGAHQLPVQQSPLEPRSQAEQLGSFRTADARGSTEQLQQSLVETGREANQYGSFRNADSPGSTVQIQQSQFGARREAEEYGLFRNSDAGAGPAEASFLQRSPGMATASRLRDSPARNGPDVSRQAPALESQGFLAPSSSRPEASFVKVDQGLCTPACKVGRGVCVVQRRDEGFAASCLCTIPFAGSSCADVHETAEHMSLLAVGNGPAADEQSKFITPQRGALLRMLLLFVTAAVMTASVAACVCYGVPYAWQKAGSKDLLQSGSFLRAAQASYPDRGDVSCHRVADARISGARHIAGHAALASNASPDRGNPYNDRPASGGRGAANADHRINAPAHNGHTMSGMVVEEWVKRAPSGRGAPAMQRPAFSTIPQVVQDDPEDY